MQLVFRKFPGADVPPPAAGELCIRPRRDEDRGRRDLATLALQAGADAFQRGDGPVERVVVEGDPTLDDLLATTFAMRSLAGQPLPPGAKAFARYAALVREGLNPGNLPLEVSLEGVYLALRNGAGSDLTDPATGARFAADWSRLADAILQAAETGLDPFTAALPTLATGSDFARERAFLAKDQEVYRQDVARGERWLVKLPGDAPQGAALLLRRPKSLLFKTWCRRDQQAPLGQAYLFLGVDWGEGNWVFSTDPVQRLPIKTLADALQGEELAASPERAPKDPWFDGKPFGHTLVAAPKKGTALPEKQVLRTVKRWASARPPGAGTKRWQLLAAAAAVAVVAAAVVIVTGRTDARSHLAARGFEVLEGEATASGERGNLYVLAVGVSKYQDRRLDLDYAEKDATALVEALKLQARPLFKEIIPKVLTNEKATRDEILEDLAAIKKGVTDNDLVVVTVSAHGANFGTNDDFYIIPHDFNKEREASSGVFWSQVRVWLEGLPCRVLIVMDTCHSGSIARELRPPKTDKAMMVIAACLSRGKAHEKAAWGHGVLTLALLEGITGKYRYEVERGTPLPRPDPETGAINLEYLGRYVKDRVRELVKGGRQVVTMNQTPNVDFTTIPIATVKSAGNP